MARVDIGTTTDQDVSEIRRETKENALSEEKKRLQALTFNSILSEDDQAEIVERVIRDVDDDIANRGEYMDKLTEILDIYEGKRDDSNPKSDPFEGAADVRTMLVAAQVEVLHANLMPNLYDQERLIWRPRERMDRRQIDATGRFMRWALDHIRFDAWVDQTAYAHALEGTVASKIRWDVQWRWVQRRAIKEQSVVEKAEDFTSNDNPAARFDVGAEDYDVRYDYVKFERAVVEDPPLGDVGFPNCSVSSFPVDADELDHIWHRTRPLLADLKDKRDMGLFINTDDVEVSMSEPPEESEEQRARMQAEGTQIAQPNPTFQPTELIEYYGQFDVPGKGVMECVAWVEKNSKTFLGLMPLVAMWRSGRRPWVLSQLIPRKGRIYGKGIAHMVMELQKIIDTVHNQRLDIGTMTIIPMGVYRAGSGFEPDQLQARPGLWIPVDDVNDAKPIALPNNTITTFQEENFLLRVAERLTSIGELQSGQESSTIGTRATARGTIALLARSDLRTNVLASRIRTHISRVIKMLLLAWQDKMPGDMADRVVGDDGDALFSDGLTPAEIAGDFDVELEIDPTGGSKQAEIDNALSMYQLLMQNPLVVSNPALVWQISANLLEKTGMTDIESFIGPKPPEQPEVTDLVKDEISQLNQGRLPKSTQVTPLAEVFIGLLSFTQTNEFRRLPAEKSRLFLIRMGILQAEMVKQIQRQQAERQAQQQAGGDLGAGVVGPEGPQPQDQGLAGPAGPGVAGAPQPQPETVGQVPTQGGGELV